MADSVVRMILELQDKATPALKGAAAAADKLAASAADVRKVEAALKSMATEATRSRSQISKLERQLATLRRQSVGAKKSLGDTGDSAKALAEKAGDADSVVLGLGGTLGLVSPEAEKLAVVFGDLAAGAEAVLRSGSGLARLLGPIALAVAALGAAYTGLAANAAKARDQMKKSADAADAMASAHHAVKEAILLQKFALGEITADELARVSAATKARDLFAGMIADAQNRKKALEDEGAALQKRIDAETKLTDALGRSRDTRRAARDAGAVGLSGQRYAEQAEESGRAAEALDGLLEKQGALELRASNVSTELDHLNAAMGRYSDALVKADTAPTVIAAAAADAKVASDEVGALVASFNALAPALPSSELSMLIQAAEVLEDIEKRAAEMGKQRAAELGLTDAALQQMRDRVEAKIAEMIASATGVELEVDADTTAAETEVRRFALWAESQGISLGGGVSTAAGFADLASSAGSDTLGTTISAVSSVGPWGQLVGAILGALDMLGQTTEDGQMQIVASVLEADAALVAGVEALPRFLERGLPRIIETTMVRVPSAIITALPEILRAATMLAIRELPAAIVGALPAIVDYIVDALRTWWDSVQEKGVLGSMAQEGESDADVAKRIAAAVLSGGVSETVNEVDDDRSRSRSASRSSAMRSLPRGSRAGFSALAGRFDDPGRAALRRFEVGETARAQSGRPFGGGGNVHIHSEFVDGDAVDRIAQRLQSNQGSFGGGMPHGVFNAGAS